jgi:flavin-dependent dehydrogenase
VATNRTLKVAIIGGGPVGASLAAYLAREGASVVVFNTSKRPPIVVGESLVPAVVPFLRKLGIEDEVADYSTFKPGASFLFGDVTTQSFRFAEALGAEVKYSYNVPRDRFDASVLDAARRAGARVIDERATIDADRGTDHIVLTDAASASAAELLDGTPDWIIDAGGRARTVARALVLPFEEGPRKDAALHAHLEGVPLQTEGHVHTDRLSHGWCWRIPLPDRVSVGFVVDDAYLADFGDSVEAQYDNFLIREPVLAYWAGAARRITPVVRYNNYQLRSHRGVGRGWALVGDAFGFVDPVFSSGLLIGMSSAEKLATALLNGSAGALERYESYVTRQLSVWQRLVDYYYDGRLFTLFEVGDAVRKRRSWKLIDRHLQRHLPRVFTGEATQSRYSVGLLDFMVRYAIVGHDPAKLEVR